MQCEQWIDIMNEDNYSDPASLPHSLPEATDDARGHVQKVWHDSQEIGRANLVPTVLGALALGFVLGMMVRPRELTLHEKYLEGPLEELKSSIAALSEIAAKKAGDGSEAATDLINSLTEKVKRNFKLF